MLPSPCSRMTGGETATSFEWDDTKVATEYMWMIRAIREDKEGNPIISAPELLSDLLVDNEALLLKYIYAHGGAQEERLSASLVHVMATQDIYTHLHMLISSDVEKTAERAFILSGNGLAPMLSLTFLKMCMQPFLERTVAPLLTNIMEAVIKKKGKELSEKLLLQASRRFLQDVIAHEPLLPPEVDMVLGWITKAVSDKFPGSGEEAAMFFFCFRVLSPTIVSHDIASIAELRTGGFHRSVAAVGKVVQHICALHLSAPVQATLKPYLSLFKAFTRDMRERLLRRVVNGLRGECFTPTTLCSVVAKTPCSPPCRCFAAVEASDKALNDSALMVANMLRAAGKEFFKESSSPLDASSASLPPRESLEARLLHARVHWGNTETFCRAVESILLTDGMRLLPNLGSSVSPKLANDALLLCCLNGAGAMLVASFITSLRSKCTCSCCFLFTDCPESHFGFELFVRHFLLVSGDWLSAAFANFFPDNDNEIEPFALAAAGLQGLAAAGNHEGLAVSASALRVYVHLIKASRGMRAARVLFVQCISSFLAQACCTPKQQKARELLVATLLFVVEHRHPSPTVHEAVASLQEQFADSLATLFARLLGECAPAPFVAHVETKAAGECSITKRLKAANNVCDKLLLAVRLSSTPPSPTASSASLPLSPPNMQKMLFALEVVDRMSSAPVADAAGPSSSWLRDSVGVPDCLQVDEV